MKDLLKAQETRLLNLTSRLKNKRIWLCSYAIQSSWVTEIMAIIWTHMVKWIPPGYHKAIDLIL